jgi:LysR family carnitine catabolism transcriptional activator
VDINMPVSPRPNVRRETISVPQQFTLRHLRAFVAIAEDRNFTIAAKHLGMSKSNLSAAVSVLENSIGMRLFDRHTRKVVLTPRAADLLPRLRSALSELDNVITSAVDGEAAAEHTTRIAVPPAWALDVLPRLTKLVLVVHPVAQIEIIDCTRPQIFEALRSGTADFGFVVRRDLPSDMRGQEYFLEEFVAALRPDHPLASRATLLWSDLHRHPLIGPTSDQVLYSILRDENRRHGHTLKLAYQTVLQSTILGLTAQGLGIGLASARMYTVIERMGLTWKRIQEPVVQFRIDMVFPRGRPLSAAASRVRDALFAARSQIKPPPQPGIGTTESGMRG